jgi:hypothetical protein
MTLREILWRNWERWAVGGLSPEMLNASTPEGDRTSLIAWFNKANTHFPNGQPDLKTIVDAASWCLYGMHSVVHYPARLRRQKVAAAAQNLGLSVEALRMLVAERDCLPAAV